MLRPNVDRAPDDRRARRPLRPLAAAVIVLLGALVAACASGGSPGARGGDGESAAAATPDEPPITESTHPDPEDLKVVSAPEQEGVQHLKFKFGPIDIEPGQNNITYSGFDIPKPTEDGYIVGLYPNLVREDGSVPPVDVIHLHHGVWANLSADAAARRAGGGRAELFFASGEEKTKTILPAGYGYAYHASDRWVINYMLHNLLSTPDKVWIVYDMDFIPASSPGAAKITPARPLWMDVQKGNIYPVFDVLKGTGTDGEYTYPDDAGDVYGSGRRLNEWVVDRDSVLIAAAGHLHPGGKHVDLKVRRDGVQPSPEVAPRLEGGNTAHILQSDAVYYEPAGAVSWDVTMTASPEDWRIAVKAGDVLSVSATYDTTRASWYESMGISVVWMTDGTDGVDPFQQAVDPQDTVLTHGHLPENDNHGGEATDEFVDASTLPTGDATGQVTIADFTYAPGDIGGIYNAVPAVPQGGTLTFNNLDGPTEPNGIWHTITACAAPCNGATGVGYPLADADVQFDSGELGVAGPPTAGRLQWTIPDNLGPGTYTYFCRIHPSMRGAFRVTP
jgi:plastocyanin